MQTLDIAQRRLINQRLICPTFETAADAVGWFGAVQAQDYPAALWAIGQRMKGATEATVEQAMADARILRTHSMRGTWHFIAAEDIRWFLSLTGPRQIDKFRPLLNRLGLDQATLERGMTTLAAALQGGRQLTRKELIAALVEAEVPAEDLRPTFVMAYAESAGLIASGARRGKQQTYALIDDLAPESRRLERDEALAELTRRYFMSHGPATVRDFVWWSGLTVADVKAGLEMAKPDLASEVIEGETYWFSPALPDQPIPEPLARLLPPFDEFTVAYKDRSALQHPLHVEETKNPFINLGPVIVVNGRVAGTWKRTIGKGSVTVSLTPFAPLTDDENEALMAAVRRYGEFLELPVIIA